ncbi:MAG: TonB-dependent receptor plug domain-containing protein [Bacteroidota bacterium]
MGRDLDLNKDIDPMKVEKIDVLKGNSAIAIYGEDGKKGVVVITTKQGKGMTYKTGSVTFIKDQSQKTGIAPSNADFDEKIVFVNGKKLGLWKDVHTQIDRNRFKEINIYDKGHAPAGYEAYNDQGVIIFNDKEGAKTEVIYEERPRVATYKETPGVGIYKEAPEKDGSSIIISKAQAAEKGQPLFVVNEEVLGKKEDLLQEIKPEDIESITVLKGPSATTLYGNDGKDGVILIYLKGYKPKKQSRKEKKIRKLEKATSVAKVPTVTGYRTPATEEKATALEATPATSATAKTIKPLVEGLKIFPNPFSQNIAVSFTLPEEGRMRVSIFDNAGKLVKVLADENLQEGYQEFVWQGVNAPSGNYTVVIENGSGIKMSKNIVKQ